MEDDDRKLEAIGADNPAVTVPASSGLPLNYDAHHRSQTRQAGPAPGPAQDHFETSNSATSTSSNNTCQEHKERLTVSNPTGDVGVVEQHGASTNSDIDSKYEHGWRRVVRNFSPSWFSTTMGTGVVSLLLITIPFKADWLYWLSVVFFVLNTILFTSAFTVSVLRYGLYPEIWSVMIRDPTNSLFLGTIPMGFATLVESWYFLCCPYWGHWSVIFAWVAWMIDSVAAFAVTVGLMFLLISESHQNQLDRITAAQLLPIAATIVASGAGAEVAELLMHIGYLDHALGTLVTSYVMWGMSTPFAMTVLVLYYQRLALHKLPPREIIVSSFLPLGPLGMGGYTIFYAGKVARELLPQVEFLSDVSVAGDMLYVMGMLVALIMWGFGIVWMILALATIWSSRPFPFNMGWWGFTFPLGVFAISTITFGVEMPSMFFKVLGTMFSVAVIMLWCVVAAGTAKGAWTGKLFYAPCLKNLARPQEDKPKTMSANHARVMGRATGLAPAQSEKRRT
ncbi:Plasma membrane sulfite pump involved in sulfite metabolism [Gnomoniopsis smithogilvyi]|uniref:Plasma membrane sulfite pump involved in sulfite metabolism n=1 Tax=Gnomoniopsis smithogilvyi TaxID=1191159 RepID=A0A9W9CZ97_9PEZI|nr:Plasma membrane sulfite pump involved in sulfite metabolism [Gnomoniopsis smithogilvyi]